MLQRAYLCVPDYARTDEYEIGRVDPNWRDVRDVLVVDVQTLDRMFIYESQIRLESQVGRLVKKGSPAVYLEEQPKRNKLVQSHARNDFDPIPIGEDLTIDLNEVKKRQTVPWLVFNRVSQIRRDIGQRLGIRPGIRINDDIHLDLDPITFT